MNPEELIVPALRLEAVPWPSDASGALEAAVIAAASDHGVAPLLAAAPAVERWPDGVRSTLGRARRAEAAIEVVRRQDLIALLDALQRASVRALLLKGTQLAYTHYPHPWLRPRLDTDLLVASRDRSRADEVLRELGYRPATGFDGTLVTHQFQYERTDRFGFTNAVDLHWKVANPHVFAEVFTFDELDAEAVSISALHAHARGPSDAHALVLACVHRVAHHDNSDRFIWLYDIHLLIRVMNPESRHRLAALASAKQLRSVCAAGVEHARARFATPVPAGWLGVQAPPSRKALRRTSTADQAEPTAAFLRNGRTKVDILISDLRALRGTRLKARLIREHLFPPADYMRREYGSVNAFLLPLTYIHRIATGVGNWFRREP